MTPGLFGVDAITVLLVFLAVGAVMVACSKAREKSRIRRSRQRELLRIRTKAARAHYQLDAHAHAARRALLDLLPFNENMSAVASGQLQAEGRPARQPGPVCSEFHNSSNPPSRAS